MSLFGIDNFKSKLLRFMHTFVKNNIMTCFFYLSLVHQMLFSSQRPYQGKVIETLQCLGKIYEAFSEVPSIPRVDLSLSLKNIFKNIIYNILILLIIQCNYYSVYIHIIYTLMINKNYL